MFHRRLRVKPLLNLSFGLYTLQIMCLLKNYLVVVALSTRADLDVLELDLILFTLSFNKHIY